MPIIVGVPRSGTTLLRFMLDSHPLMAIPPETGFLAAVASIAQSHDLSPRELFQIMTEYPPDAPGWADFGLGSEQYWNCLRELRPFTVSQGLRAFYRLYATRHGKPRHGEKTPLYCEHIESIGKILPEAHFIHIIRDGRDVALSLRKMWFAPAKDVATLARYWQTLIRSARAAGSTVPHYLEVRYEEIVADPEPTLKTICEFIDLAFERSMLDYWQRTPERLKEHGTRRRRDGTIIVSHQRRLEQQRLTMQPPRRERLRRWQVEMTLQEKTDFVRIAGETLDDLGYEANPASESFDGLVTIASA